MISKHKEYIVQLTNEEIEDLSFSFFLGDDDSDPSEIRFGVGLIEGAVKVEIFSNEHPPPHFRVLYQGGTANFRIDDCSLLNGRGSVLRYRKKIKNWWKENKDLLIDRWNSTRPDDCPVGLYKE